MMALKENKMKPTKVKAEHFDQALGKVKPGVSKETTDAYQDFQEEVGKYKPSYVR